MGSVRSATDGALRPAPVRPRPAAGPRVRLGSARAVPPRDRRPGAWAIAGRRDARRALPRPRSSRLGSQRRRSTSRGAYRAVRRRPAAQAARRLAIDRVDVVGGSIGDLWALSLAEHHPARVGRLVLLGGGPIVADVPRAALHPGAGLADRRGHRPPATRAGIGCGPSFATTDTGRASRTGASRTSFIGMAVAAANDTRVDATRARHGSPVVHGPGYRPGIMFEDGRARRGSTQPSLLVYGTADPTGDVEIWRHVHDALPNGSLQLIEGPATSRGSSDATRVAERGRRASWRDRRAIRRPSRRPRPAGRAPRGRRS